MKLAVLDTQPENLKGNLTDQNINYWKEKLKGVSLLQLPTDYPRTAIPEINRSVINFTIDKALTDQLLILTREYETTLFTTLLAGFNTILHRHSTQNDICISAVIPAGELEIPKDFSEHPDIFALRSKVDNEATFSTLLQQLKTTILDAVNHPILFDKVLSAVAPEHNMPVLQLMFALNSQSEIKPFKNHISGSELACILTVTKDNLHGALEYNTILYKKQSIERIIEHYKQVLYAVVKNPEQKLGTLPILTGEEENLLLKFNDTLTDYPENKTIVDLFEEQVLKTPDDVALIQSESSITYRQLNEKANMLARYLLEQGVKENGNVGLLVSRHFNMIIGMYAILKAGGTYIPIDPEYPADRQKYILNQSSATHVITDATYPVMDILSNLKIININAPNVNGFSNTNLETQINSRQLAYTIYTSGSTGVPKGVMIEHQSAVNLILWVNNKFNIGKHDRILFITSMCFDLSVYDIFGMLSAGGSVVIARQEDISDVSKLKDLLHYYKITFWDSVPTTMNYLIRELQSEQEKYVQKSLRLVFLSGDWIPVHLPDDIKEHFPNAQVVSLGGATEGTIWSNFYPIKKVNPSWLSIPYGKPIANNFFYVLNEQLHPVPVGVTGELYIGGVGVARGYANDKEKTNYSFLKDPFNDRAGGRMYRTGDLGRMLSDGNLEFLGRKDNQIKIRGYRVELGEIENVLNQCDLVNQAVVIPKANKDGNKNLIAYIVPKGNFYDQAIILAHLRRQLPEYMIPEVLVKLKQLPLTSNGKIDKKALSDIDAFARNGNAYSPPFSKNQLILADIWKEILGVEKIDIHDNFFELGGHSLIALRLIASVRTRLGVDLKINDLFLNPTIEKLANLFESQSEAPERVQIIKIEPKPEHIPLSFNQESLWFIDQLKGSLQYHIPIVFKIEGELNQEALAYALQAIVSRHEIFRTVIRKIDGKPWQYVMAPDNWKLSVIDGQMYRNDPVILRETIERMINIPFDLANDYMLRAGLIRLDAKEHTLVLTQHHIASDGWSKSIFFKEIAVLYRAYIDSGGYSETNKSILPSLNVQYTDYTIWQRTHLKGTLFDHHIAYWKNKLNGTIPLILPADYPRPAVQSTKGAIHDFTIDNRLADQLLRLSEKHEATLFMTLLAVFKVMLYRYSNQNDICVGTAVAGREHREIQDLIGYFINTLALRSELNEEITFTDLLQQLKVTTLDAFEHQQVSIEQIVASVAPERNPGTNPLFQIMFIFQNLPEIKTPDLGNVKISESAFEHSTSKFDLSFVITETAEGLEGIVEFRTDLYKEQTITRMVGHYIRLLQSVVNAPEQKLVNLPMLTTDEEHQLLFEFNDTMVNYPQDKSLVDIFEEQVNKTPDNVAVLSESGKWTFKYINERSNQLAFYLRSRGVKEESFVPICIENSLQMIIGILGILKAGAAYVPISPEDPPVRINYILKDLNPVCLVCGHQNILNITNPENYEIIKLDKTLSFLDDQPAFKVNTNLNPHNLAYVIYTSGTTGNPKGVLIEHQSIVNYFVTNKPKYIRESKEGPGSFIYLSFTFDASLLALFMPLLSGKSVVIGSGKSTEGFKDPLFLKNAPYDFIALTPSHLPLLEDAISSEDTLAAYNLIIGGEPLQSKHLNFLYKAQKEVKIINEYGPTEATIGCASFSFNLFDIDKFMHGKVPIGSPNPNMQCYILNKNGGLAPIGVAGELCISGPGLARGYLNLPELTAQKFILNPFNPALRMYLTGDICRWLPDGKIEYLERKDDQVKIRGYRIELTEIENALQHCDLVKSSAVLFQDDKKGQKRLIGYVQSNGSFNPDGIIAYLKDRLPEYMIPGLWLEVEQFPLTVNGKIDKASLPDFDISNQLKNQYLAPRNENERALVEIWQDSLQVERVGIRDNFFELGGHSLMAVRIMTKTEQKLGKKLPLSILFKYPTIDSLLSSFEKNQSDLETPWKSLVPIKDSGSKVPIYIIHGSGLNVLNFSNIAMHVDPEQPVFGLQAKGLNGVEDPLDDMKEIARSYIEEILEHNTSGPYAIAGYSFGGYVAIEMRNQLEAMGKKVKMLAIFDTNAVDSDYYQKWHSKLFKKITRQFPKFLWILKSLLTRPVSTIKYQNILLLKFFKNTTKKFIKSGKDESNEFYTRLNKINEKHWHAFRSYRLAPFNDTVHLFRAKDRIYYVSDFKYLGWQKYAQKGVKIYEVPGDHETMFLSPHAIDFAHALQHALDNC